MKKQNFNFPTKIKIGGHFVNVEVSSYEPRTNGNMGSSWNSHNLIQISTRFPKSQQEVTLLHEILHHILNNLGHGYDRTLGSSAIHTEQNVEAISQALYQVFKDNPSIKF